jgi:hypothetical protein
MQHKPRESRPIFVDDNVPAWFLIDSGDLDVVMAAPHVARSNGPETWSAELRLRGLCGTTTQIRTHDIIHDGALSEEFLRKFTWTFDLKSSRV